MIKLNQSSLRRFAFAFATASALGFGATQALAPAQEGNSEARACSKICEPECGGFGGELRHWQCLCCG